MRTRLQVLGVFLSGLVAFMLLETGSACAGECAAPEGATAALGEQRVEARLDYIRDSMRDTLRMESRFLIGWTLGYGAMAAGTWILVPLSDDPKQRVASIWSSASAAGGALLNLIQPMRVVTAQRRVEKLLAQTPPAEQRCAQLAAAERLFAQAASNESGARSPISHLSSILSNVGLALLQAYAVNRPDSAATSLPLGILIGELLIWTRPQVAVRRLASYRAGDLSPPPPRKWYQLTALPVPLPLAIDGGQGLALSGTF